jgi:hypothetical protein
MRKIERVENDGWGRRVTGLFNLRKAVEAKDSRKRCASLKKGTTAALVDLSVFQEY